MQFGMEGVFMCGLCAAVGVEVDTRGVSSTPTRHFVRAWGHHSSASRVVETIELS